PKHSVTLALVARAHGGLIRIADARDPRARQGGWTSRPSPRSRQGRWRTRRTRASPDRAADEWALVTSARVTEKIGKCLRGPVTPAFHRPNLLSFLANRKKPPPLTLTPFGLPHTSLVPVAG